ncbi:hypothetical protein OQA88_5144 [Cercophora sp. LCS_1]
MGDYYWNSFMTIAAAASTNAFQGLFRKRDTAAVYPCTISLQRCKVGARKPETPTFMTVAPSLREMFPRDQRERQCANTLNSRGWTLQEQILSRRLLLFGQIQVSFACSNMLASENTPCGEPRRAGDFAMRGGQSDLPYLQGVIRSAKVHSGSMLPTPECFHYDAWNAMLVEYSKRKLTKQEDLFPALSGLARRFYELMLDRDDVYLAGIWKSDLKRSLLWMSPPDGPPGGPPDGSHCGVATRRHDAYTAPTWSPLSVEITGKTHVVLDEMIIREDGELAVNSGLFVVLSASTTPKGSNPFGEVAAGELKARCRMKTVRLGFNSKGFPFIFDIDVKENFAPVREDVSEELDPFRSGEREVANPTWEEEINFDPGAPSLYCVPVILEERSTTTAGLTEFMYIGLVLVVGESGEGVVYRRVGLSHIPKDFDWFESCPESEITIW